MELECLYATVRTMQSVRTWAAAWIVCAKRGAEALDLNFKNELGMKEKKQKKSEEGEVRIMVCSTRRPVKYIREYWANQVNLNLCAIKKKGIECSLILSFSFSVVKSKYLMLSPQTSAVPLQNKVVSKHVHFPGNVDILCSVTETGRAQLSYSNYTLYIGISATLKPSGR